MKKKTVLIMPSCPPLILAYNSGKPAGKKETTRSNKEKHFQKAKPAGPEKNKVKK